MDTLEFRIQSVPFLKPNRCEFKFIFVAQDLADESQRFLDHNTGNAPQSPTISDVAPPDSYVLEENEERSMIEPQSKQDPKLKTLVQVTMKCLVT